MRSPGVALADALLFAIAYAAAFALRFDGVPGPMWLQMFWRTLPAVVAIQVAAFWVLRLHRQLWAYVSLVDLRQLALATALSAVVESAALVYPLRQHGIGYPRSVIIVNAALVLLLCGGARLAVRVGLGRLRPRAAALRRVAVIGAGSAGDSVLREMLHHPELGYEPVCLLDDDPRMIGNAIHGLRIRPISELVQQAHRRGATEVIIALPAATRQEMQRILELVGQTGLPSKTVPAMSDLIDGTVSVSRLRPVEIADLLNREQMGIDLETVAGYLQGRRVLVTGAGGAIGMELSRQVLQVAPELLVLLSRGENSLYQAHRKLRAEFAEAGIHAVQCDVVNRRKLDQIISKYRFHVIFHAAANKHVPLSEINVDETLMTNVIGTRNLLESAAAHGVQRVVCVSTDKAVEARSVMGASKRVAEMLVLGADYPLTICTSVRFGNVLGSRGSVVPLFQEQIGRGEPVTITDPNMTRYFMTISEAAQLVLQAGAFSRGGDLFVLEMGQPLKIIDLARQMIRLSGLRPEADIPIKIIGRRPGEKLHEALCNAGEELEPTGHQKIRRIMSPQLRPILPAEIEELREICAAGDHEAVRGWLAERIPSFGIPEVEQPRMFTVDPPEREV